MGIMRDCADRWKDRKGEVKQHFVAHGGLDDLETSRAHPHEYCTPEAWNKLIDEVWNTPEHRAKSRQNSENRGKQRYPSTGGSRSYAQLRHENIKERGSTSHIENWAAMHLKKGGGWINEQAADDYERIKDVEREMQEAAGSEQIDEALCLSQALGERRGWTRGLGRRVRNVEFDSSQHSTSVSRSEYEELQEQMRQSQENQARMQAQIDAILKGQLARQNDSDEPDD